MQSFVVFYWSSIRLNLKCCVLKLDFGWFRDNSAFYEIMQIQGHIRDLAVKSDDR